MMIKQVLAIAAGILFLLPPPAIAAEPSDVLNMSQGAVVLSYTSEYSDTQWSALNVFDGNPATTWCSKNKSPQQFVVELSQKFQLQSLAADTRQAQESQYKGISAKSIEVWGSTTSATAGFTKLTTIVAPAGDRAEFPLPENSTAQWLKFVITDNWGDGKYIELSELEAYGTPVGAAKNPSFTGTYTSNWGPMKLVQKGNLVTGCYTHQTGSVRGATEGHVLRFDWRQKGNGNAGTAMMVLNSAGTVLNGAWYVNGTMRGEWLGKRDNTAECNCNAGTVGGIAERLTETNRAIIYGIYFDTNSAVIKPQSEPALADVLSALNQKPTLKVQIEGHTDSTNTDQYNLTLSQNRAQAVVGWLKAHGIAADRLAAKGFGESKPVADNATPQGRALNRRVEVATVN